MSNLLCYGVYELKGLSMTDSAVLFQLAFAVPKDGNTVNIAMETLAHRVKCNVRTARRSLRRLEEWGYLVNIGEKGRGHILKYVVNPVAKKPVEEVPVKPPEEVPPTNGHKPAMTPPRNSYTPDPLSPEALAKRRADAEALRARLAAKRTREEPTRVRTGRTERERARMVQGQSPLDGGSGGDETPGSME